MAELAGDGRKVKRFRVAREGQTVDGRVLTRQDIQDMAETYNIDEYGARINVEHIAGFSPEPPFNAYGDILLVDAAEENGLLCLYNTISALPNMLAILDKGQKIYPSIEFIRDFAGRGKSYQVGLGLTDFPASLGTQAIKFNAYNVHGHVVRTAPDQELFIMTQATQPQTFASKINTLLSGMLGSQQQTPPAATPPAPTPAAPPVDQFQAATYQALQQVFSNQNNLAQAIQTLSAQLSQTPPATPVPAATPTPTPAPTAAQQLSAPPAQPTTQPPAQPTMEQLMSQLVAGQTDLKNTIQQLAVTPANPAAPTATGGSGGLTNEF